MAHLYSERVLIVFGLWLSHLMLVASCRDAALRVPTCAKHGTPTMLISSSKRYVRLFRVTAEGLGGSTTSIPLASIQGNGRK